MENLVSRLLEHLEKTGGLNAVISVIDRDLESMLYLDAIEALKQPIQSGEYVWIVAYDSLQNTLRDLKRMDIDYGSYLGKTLFILDAFGSVKRVPTAPMEGIITLSGYIDDNVFVLKYREAIKNVLNSLPEVPKRVYVLGYNESGMCRIFRNPVKVQRLVWGLRREVPFQVLKISTHLQPECPTLEEFLYMGSDFVIEGFVEENQRKAILTKGVLP